MGGKKSQLEIDRTAIERLRPLLWKLSKENKPGVKDWSSKGLLRPPLR